MKRFFTILLILFACALAASADPAATQTQSPEGSWEGMLSVSGSSLRLVLKIAASTDGALKASLDSPDQGAADLKVDVITFKSGSLHFEMRDLSVSYDGAFSRDGSEILGAWQQGGNSFALILRKPGQPQPTAAVRRGRVQLKPCANPALTNEALCGKYEVFEDRAAKAGVGK